jgi:hypothetical protein
MVSAGVLVCGVGGTLPSHARQIIATKLSGNRHPIARVSLARQDVMWTFARGRPTTHHSGEPVAQRTEPLYSTGLSQGYPPAANPAPQNSARRVLVASLGVFLGVVAAAMLLIPAGLLVFSWILAGPQDSSPDPEIVVTSCAINDSRFGATAEVEWSMTNLGDRTGNWTIHIAVDNAQGQRVGDTFLTVYNIDPGASVAAATTVHLNAPDGQSCKVSLNI